MRRFGKYMSKFSKIPVKIPEGVKVEIGEDNVLVSGPKGALKRQFPRIVNIEMKGDSLTVSSKEKSKFADAILGTIRSHIVNMVAGVTNGWSKKLEIVGTGYRAEVKDGDLVLTVGFSHPIIVKPLEGIKFEITKNVISVEGIDRETVGKLSAEIKAVRPPDPYKGKGIRYLGEELKLKPGKQAAKVGGAA